MSTTPFSLGTRRPAVVAIDCHRGHLDPSVATMPLETDKAERIIRANVRLLEQMRDRDVPIVHVLTSYRSSAEIVKNPWWAAVAGTTVTRRNVLNHQLAGGPGVQIIPALLNATDIVVSTKKRYDSFFGTDLDHVLRSLDVDTVMLTGVNTNSCVLATAVSANVRDYAVVVVRDCVETMDPDLHGPALALIEGAFGWAMTTQEVVNSLAHAPAMS